MRFAATREYLRHTDNYLGALSLNRTDIFKVYSVTKDASMILISAQLTTMVQKNNQKNKVHHLTCPKDIL